MFDEIRNQWSEYVDTKIALLDKGSHDTEQIKKLFTEGRKSSYESEHIIKEPEAVIRFIGKEESIYYIIDRLNAKTTEQKEFLEFMLRVRLLRYREVLGEVKNGRFLCLSQRQVMNIIYHLDEKYPILDFFHKKGVTVTIIDVAYKSKLFKEEVGTIDKSELLILNGVSVMNKENSLWLAALQVWSDLVIGIWDYLPVDERKIPYGFADLCELYGMDAAKYSLSELKMLYALLFADYHRRLRKPDFSMHFAIPSKVICQNRKHFYNFVVAAMKFELSKLN